MGRDGTRFFPLVLLYYSRKRVRQSESFRYSQDDYRSPFRSSPRTRNIHLDREDPEGSYTLPGCSGVGLRGTGFYLRWKCESLRPPVTGKRCLTPTPLLEILLDPDKTFSSKFQLQLTRPHAQTPQWSI